MHKRSLVCCASFTSDRIFSTWWLRRIIIVANDTVVTPLLLETTKRSEPPTAARRDLPSWTWLASFADLGAMHYELQCLGLLKGPGCAVMGGQSSEDVQANSVLFTCRTS